MGRLAQRLSAHNLNFTEICRQHTVLPIPPTFCTGSIPIKGIFVTPGIECANVFLLPHLGGVGDHRCFIIDFSFDSTMVHCFQILFNAHHESFTAPQDE
jgi:hypothetical protein